MKVVKIRPIRPPGRVGVFSPAGPVTEAKIENGVATLASHGYTAIAAPHTFDDAGIVSSSIDNRLSDIYGLLASNDCQCLWATRGGYGTNQLIPQCNFTRFEESPKLLIGFSDLTAFQWALYQQTGLPSLSGLTLTMQCAPENPYLNIGFEMVESGRTGLTTADLLGAPLRIYQPGDAEGIIIGGTLTMICTLAGSPYWPEIEKLILYLEDVGEPLYRIDRCLQQLAMTGIWNRVSGLMLGKFRYQNSYLDVLPLIRPFIPADIPVICDFPYGHFAECCPLPQGIHGTLTANPFKLSWNPLFK